MEFRLPDIGEGVAEGEILKWMVKEGDRIKEDQPLVEIMTDKVNVQIPSPWAGTVTKVLAKEGETVKVGSVLVVIAEEGEPAAQAGEVSQHAPTYRLRPEQLTPASPVGTGSGAAEPSPQERVMATPATRRLARELGVDLGAITGTGSRGRIIDEDVRAAARKPKPPAQQVATGAARASQPAPRVAQPEPSDEVIPLKGLRKVIAERMTRSARTVAQVVNFDEVDMTELVLLREAFKGSAEKKGVHLTYLPFVIKAVVPALMEFPFMNSVLDEEHGSIVLKKRYNVGIAVDTSEGLVVPVVKDADSKDVFELAGEIQGLAEKAKANQLGLEDVRGSTFTITNLGAVGGLSSTPLTNYPEVAILGTYKIVKRPVVRDGIHVEIRDMMNLSLSYDHRVVDGAYAARFINRVVGTLQDTKKLLAEIL